MVSCCVPDCCTTRRNNPSEATFHRFPVNPVIKEKWLRMIHRLGWEPRTNSVVCSMHFNENCFVQRAHRRLLRRESVPTEHVPVKIKPKRPVTAYIYRDILPELLTSQPKPLTQKLIAKCSQLKNKLIMRKKYIRNLKAKNKRLQTRVTQAHEVINELQKRLTFKDNFYEISTVYNNETLNLLVEKSNVYH